MSIPAIRNMYNAYHANLWGPYGFRDAFNLSQAWFDTDYLGIDEGPIAIMIENYRSRAVWDVFMTNPSIQLGLQRAGFVRTTAVGDEAALSDPLLANEPNPFQDATTLRFRLAVPGRVKLAVYDVAGREVARLVDGQRAAGLNQVTLDGRGLRSGVYYYRLDALGRSYVKRCVLLR